MIPPEYARENFPLSPWVEKIPKRPELLGLNQLDFAMGRVTRQKTALTSQNEWLALQHPLMPRPISVRSIFAS